MNTIWGADWTDEMKRASLEKRVKKQAHLATQCALDQEWAQVEQVLDTIRKALEDLHEVGR